VQRRKEKTYRWSAAPEDEDAAPEGEDEVEGGWCYSSFLFPLLCSVLSALLILSLSLSVRSLLSLLVSVLCFFVCVRSPLVFRVCLFGGGDGATGDEAGVRVLAGQCFSPFHVSTPVFRALSALCFLVFFFFNLLCFLEKKQRNESLLIYSSFPSLLCPFFLLLFVTLFLSPSPLVSFVSLSPGFFVSLSFLFEKPTATARPLLFLFSSPFQSLTVFLPPLFFACMAFL